MSQFNQTTETENNQNKKNSSIIYWVVILILLAGCIYLFVSKNKMAEENSIAAQNMNQQMDSVKTDRESLQGDFEAASAKIDELVTQNTKLDEALQADKAEMVKMQEQIKTILSNKNATQAELKKAREMINGLSEKTRVYETRIAELEQQNTELTGQNKVLTNERDSTAAKNVALKQLASVLHASNIRLEPIHLRRNGKEKETSKARKVDVLRIKFDIDENRITESGLRQIYVRMIAPDGSILGNPANVSGMMNVNNGGQLGYSVLKDVNINKDEMMKDLTIDWNQNGDYKKGDYIIEIYNEGFKVGTGKVTLR